MTEPCSLTPALAESGKVCSQEPLLPDRCLESGLSYILDLPFPSTEVHQQGLKMSLKLSQPRADELTSKTSQSLCFTETDLKTGRLKDFTKKG